MEKEIPQKMEWSYVGIPKPLYERIRKVVKSAVTDFTGVRDYVRHCIRKDIRMQEALIAGAEARWRREHEE